MLDYPLGRAAGRQLLAVRGIRADDRLDPGLVSWVDGNLDTIYAGLAEGPTAPDTTHRFFAPPGESPGAGVSTQDRLLYLMGRRPAA